MDALVRLIAIGYTFTYAFVFYNLSITIQETGWERTLWIKDNANTSQCR